MGGPQAAAGAGRDGAAAHRARALPRGRAVWRLALRRRLCLCLCPPPAAACGKHHTLVVTAGSEAYSFGSNMQGQLGRGAIKAKGKEEGGQLGCLRRCAGGPPPGLVAHSGLAARPC